MQILFVHSNYPAQFGWIAAALGQQPGHEVRFLTARPEAAQHPMAGVQVELFAEPEPLTLSPLHQATAVAISRAAVIEEKLFALAQTGFVPRLAVVHGGNGLGLLIKQLIPNCLVLGYFEWYFDPKSAVMLLGRNDRQARQQVQLRNLAISQELLGCDAAIVPTAWQASQFPKELATKLEVVFDGIDPSLFQPPASQARDWPLSLQGESGGLELAAAQPLLTYATRGMEPMRGFPEFMRALPAVLAARPDLQVLIAGRDRSAYGPVAPSHGGSWKAALLDELGEFPGRERICFTGLLHRDQWIAMLQRTNLHCYFSLPYVPSWSLFEAAACGAPLLTNRGGTTTGCLPQLLETAIDPSSGEEVHEAIIDALQNPTIISVLEPQWWRPAAVVGWQQCINRLIQKTSIDHVPV